MLPKALQQDEVLRAARAQSALRDWHEIVGIELAKRSRPDRYSKGTVWVAVQGPAWAQELRLMKEKILARLRERSGEGALFQDLRFGVRPLPEGAFEAPEPKIEEIPRDTQLTIREIAERRLARMRSSSEPESTWTVDSRKEPG